MYLRREYLACLSWVFILFYDKLGALTVFGSCHSFHGGRKCLQLSLYSFNNSFIPLWNHRDYMVEAGDRIPNHSIPLKHLCQALS
jgi:hypothetical protein